MGRVRGNDVGFGASPCTGMPLRPDVLCLAIGEPVVSLVVRLLISCLLLSVEGDGSGRQSQLGRGHILDAANLPCQLPMASVPGRYEANFECRTADDCVA